MVVVVGFFASALMQSSNCAQLNHHHNSLIDLRARAQLAAFTLERASRARSNSSGSSSGYRPLARRTTLIQSNSSTSFARTLRISTL